MDKEEFRVKLEEINHLVEAKDYEGAMKVVDSIDWRRVKNVRTLCVVGEIYAANKRYEDSREIFLLAYHRAPIGKNILYRLIEVSLKMNDVEEAKEYYQEFLEVAADDNTRYVLNYKILTAQSAPVEERIQVLEEYKEKEFTEKWSYELAKLYYQSGQKDKCLALCNEMNLWFNDGAYVSKANDLKARINQAEPIVSETKEAAPEDQRESAAPETEDTEVQTIGSISLKNEKDLAGVESLQEKISKGLRDIFGSKKEAAAADEEAEEEEISEDEEAPADEKQETSDQEISEEETTVYVASEEETASAAVSADTGRIPEIKRAVTAKPEEESEQTKEFNLEDTILAAANAQGIQIPEEEKEEAFAPEIESKELEEEEFLSEEDLAQAEQEFLGGPAAVKAKEEAVEEEEVLPETEPVLAKPVKQPEPEEPDFFDATDAGDISSPILPVSKEEDDELPLYDMDEETLDIIPREKELNDEEKKLFTYFVKVPGMKDQLISTLCDVQDAASDKTSRTGNIIVMGGRETGKTRLISALIPAICSELNLEATKVAYVFAQDINGKDIARIVDKLSGGFLVIEDANQLTLDTVNQLNKAMEFRTDGMILILEDEKIGMRKMMARYPKFAKKFTSLINIPVFTNDELVNFAVVYTIENGYKIDQMGMLALYNQIGENQKEDEPMNIGRVKEMLDAAIEKAEGGFLKLNRKKRLDKDGFMVLHEKDFA